jgi:hypothetical protein
MWALLIYLDNFGNADSKVKLFLRVQISISAVKVFKIVRGINPSVNFENRSLQEQFHGVFEQEMHRLCVNKRFRQVTGKYRAHSVMAGVSVCRSVTKKQLRCCIVANIVINNGYGWLWGHGKSPFHFASRSEWASLPCNLILLAINASVMPYALRFYLYLLAAGILVFLAARWLSPYGLGVNLVFAIAAGLRGHRSRSASAQDKD